MKKLEYEALKKLFEKYGRTILKPNPVDSKLSDDKKNKPSKNKLLLECKKNFCLFQKKTCNATNTKIANNKTASNKAINVNEEQEIGERMKLIADASKNEKQFKDNFQTILAINKKLAAVCAREVKRSCSKTSKVNPVLKSKRLNKELSNFDKKIRRITGKSTRTDLKQEKAEKRKLEEIEEVKKQKLKFNYLLNQTEAFATYFLNRTTDNEDVKGIQAAKRQLELTKNFDEGVKKQKKSENKLEKSEEEITQYVHQDVKQPKMLKAKLKDYQLKGLNWLVSLYNQGINGILADDMGLGKTVQTISFMAYLYEEKNVERVFLVITPTSTLHNWAQEFSKFLPQFEVCEYWGTINERKEARKQFKTANVIIISYQLALLDKNYLRRIKFQYMVLDEAQAIKNNLSLRWKALLQFNARNRLLLSGTPIQNNLTELWALLHFIMPTLFDSVAEFSDWFSKEIEGKTASKNIDDEQIAKLHTILKPFMLRRHKSDIKDELGEKEEIVISCSLSNRQKILYDEILKSKLDYENTLMHLKKVCNHPDLFEKLEPHTNLTNNLILNNFDFNARLVEFRSEKKLILHESLYSITDRDFGLPEEKWPCSEFKENILYKQDKLLFLKELKEENRRRTEINRKILCNWLECNTDFMRIKNDKQTFYADIEIVKNNILKTRKKFRFRAESVVFPYINCNSYLDLKKNFNIETKRNLVLLQPEKLIEVHMVNTFINDSGKLKTLSKLMEELKKEGHRVLVYFQMTKMMDLFEEFLVKMQYEYMRLDGGTKLSQRKDLVNAWQNDTKYFVFILSTRAGGVGINLTAADTVIFYDNDWNPTVDQQAMDRVHRIGQTKNVTVYRMITKNTVEERIMEMAYKKGEMQKLVIKEDVFKGD
ncbi:swr1 [Ecytonucleospora hepatopenaei]|uniref:Chromatin-remodeling ATPase INO80 n=1 Tax=Ecytonucleospora hepatopenaei TaxID=646526 RepID=A0A1W0E8B7_9MICR|nr:swr1 [Ecytonucleospora hepatopenaei]